MLATVQAQDAEPEADAAPVSAAANATNQTAEAVAAERVANYTKLRPPLADVKVSRGCSHHFVLPVSSILCTQCGSS